MKRGGRRGRCNDLTISHEESWASGGGKQRNNKLTYGNERDGSEQRNNKLTYGNERDGSGRKQREQMKET
jgi:hypothetical protein